jgi:hypothetical protein
VNGRRIASGEIVLLCDDMVSIGELVFQVEFQPAALENGAPAALQGTRIMDGETLSSQPPKPATPPISEAADSAALPARAEATFE